MQRAKAGVMGVAKGRARFPGPGIELPVKWATAPPRTADGWNNCPRKEMAAFVIQQWFAAPVDWMVPPTAIRAIAVDDYRRLQRRARPTLSESRCVLGLIAAWYERSRTPDVVYDAARARSDRRYAARLADLNVLTYLIQHRDGRRSNFLVTTDDGSPRVFSIDNGIAFGNLVWNYFVRNWDVIRVPALRRETIARLRAVGSPDLDSLLVLQELALDAKGVFQPITPTAPFDSSRGVARRAGRVQFGLTARERDGVAHRLQLLLEQVDSGAIPLF
jgi:hypothetical protein